MGSPDNRKRLLEHRDWLICECVRNRTRLSSDEHRVGDCLRGSLVSDRRRPRHHLQTRRPARHAARHRWRRDRHRRILRGCPLHRQLPVRRQNLGSVGICDRFVRMNLARAPRRLDADHRASTPSSSSTSSDHARILLLSVLLFAFRLPVFCLLSSGITFRSRGSRGRAAGRICDHI
jgi:hypothetical protein